MKRILTLAAIAASAIALPAAAQTVSTKPGAVVSAVYDNSEIAMAPLPGNLANLGFEANPAFFQGALFCVAGLNGNWPLKHDGTLHVEPAIVDTNGTVTSARPSPRTPSCAPISANGTASVNNPFGANAVPFLLKDGHIIAWVGRDRLVGLAPTS